MPLSDPSDYLERARHRAAEQLVQRNQTGTRKRDDMVLLLNQVCDLEHDPVEDPAGAKYLTLRGAHGAAFRIAVVVGNDGSVGWSLV
jgi:hypothetical protein